MTRLYIFSSLLLLLTACAPTHPVATTTRHFQGDTAVDANGKLLLLGTHPRMDLEQPPFAAWFDTGYANYSPDTATINRLRPQLNGHTFEIFMGTWCGDSRREVPRMFKILDACGVPKDHIHLITVDYRGVMYKQSPQHEERGKDIIHVPDLLILNATTGREEGRIVESPVVTLEKDLLSVLQGDPYQPQYQGAWWLGRKLKQPGTLDLDAARDSLGSKTSNEYELTSLSYELLLHGDTAHALLVNQLNMAVFPKKPFAYSFTGKTFDRIHDTEDARTAYRQTLVLDPTNKEAKAWLDTHP